jgi:anti-sigma regulatory factor (Ser/Thr protein kinase)
LQSVELNIGNDPAGLAMARDALDRLGDAHAIPGRVVVALQVALDEIVSNVLRYARGEGGACDVHIRLAVTSAGVELTVTDDGLAFDPRQVPAPVPTPPGQRRQPGGVGIHMVRQLVDSFDYQRVDGHNRTTLTKRCVVDPELAKPTEQAKGRPDDGAGA